MLPDNRIKFLDFHLVWHIAFVLRRRVVMTCACRRHQFNFFSHLNTLHFLTAGPDITNNMVNTELVYDSHTLSRYA
jgi:hypothetical protein